MFLGNTLSSAQSGLDSIERQLAVVSQNVANASTPNYTRETLPLSSVDSSAGPAGVRSGTAQREIDTHLQANLFASAGSESAATVTQRALAGIDQASGTPGSGDDLASLVGTLRDSFSRLQTDPSSASQQNSVLDQAGSLVNGFHSLSEALVQARQTAQDGLENDVGTVNSALRAVGTISDQIISAKASGQSTAGLEDQRDGQLKTLAQLIGAKFNTQANGDVEVIAGYSSLPTRAASGPFSVGTASFTAGTLSPSVPPLQVNGRTVAGLGGSIGANLTLRDSTIPGMQSQLDGYAQSLASAFQVQGVPLLTDPAGAVPPSTGATGFADTIQVSTTIQAYPTMLRDGTSATVSAGNTAIINNVLANVFSSAASGLPAKAAGLVADFAGQATQAQSTLTASTSMRTGLESRLATESGVSVDSELAHMVQLQTAYAANAKVITAVQSMWQQLLDSVR